MFDLVERVEDYPQFLPWCGGVEVERGPGEELTATLLIDFHGIRKSFTTCNRHRPPAVQGASPAGGDRQAAREQAAGRIDLVLRDGPFSRLEGLWRFVPLAPGACRVEFALDYEFAGAVLGKALAPVFGKISANFVDAFVRRAEQIYG